MICFSNPGELDPIMLSTFGVNVKVGSNPIGRFGTGLKYGTAVALRFGCSIDIYSGTTHYTITAKPQSIRGKDFSVVWLVRDDGTESLLSFTLELGKDWEAWMAYREFYCNMLDEGGEIVAEPKPAPGMTYICVRGEAFTRAHADRHTFLLLDKPLLGSAPGLSIHAGSSNVIFYRGVKVFTTDKPTVYTYNILDEMSLTEDRTTSIYSIQARLTAGLAALSDPKLLSNVLGTTKTSFEYDLSWTNNWRTPSDTFVAEVSRRMQNKVAELSPGLFAWARTNRPKDFLVASKNVTRIELTSLMRAQAFCKKIGYEITYPVSIVDDLGTDGIGLALDEHIYLSRACFALGTKIVVGTLIEEQLHLQHGFDDCSRKFQDHLINALVSMGEQLVGEPI